MDSLWVGSVAALRGQDQVDKEVTSEDLPFKLASSWKKQKRKVPWLLDGGWGGGSGKQMSAKAEEGCARGRQAIFQLPEYLLDGAATANP